MIKIKNYKMKVYKTKIMEKIKMIIKIIKKINKIIKLIQLINKKIMKISINQIYKPIKWKTIKMLMKKKLTQSHVNKICKIMIIIKIMKKTYKMILIKI